VAEDIPHPHRIPILRRLAQDGDAYAHLALGRALWSGDGVPVDAEEGEGWIRLAARTLVPAQLLMAEIETGREGTDRAAAWRRSLPWCAAAAKSGHPEALHHDAWRWMPHRDDPGDPRRARAALERAMRAGSACAAADLARIETLGGDLRRVRRLLRFAALVGFHRDEHEFALELLRRAPRPLRRLRSRTIPEWSTRADLGDVEASMLLGYAHRFGAGIPYEPAEALRAWETAAVGGSGEAQIAIALSVWDPEMDVTPEDAAMAAAAAAESSDPVAGWLTGALWDLVDPAREETARFWQRRAAERGEPHAAYALAQFHRDREPARPSAARLAARFARIAAGAGHVGGMALLADLYDDRRLPMNEHEAVRWRRLAVERGSHDDATTLGARLHEGRGVRRDDREAVRLYRRAAAKGEPGAMTNLGRCYRRGHGVRKDARVARRWLLHAAEVFESGSAAGVLSSMYAHGELGRRDPLSATHWERRAAAMGNRDALYELGLTHHLGKHAAKDVDFARLLFRAAAEMGDGRAAFELGNCWRDGHGALRDVRQARRWWRVAERLGSPHAHRALERSFEKSPRGR
jgi:uncharacterized protein